MNADDIIYAPIGPKKKIREEGSICHQCGGFIIYTENHDLAGMGILRTCDPCGCWACFLVVGP